MIRFCSPRLWNGSGEYIKYTKCTLTLRRNYLQAEISLTVLSPEHIQPYCQYHQSIKCVFIVKKKTKKNWQHKNVLNIRSVCCWILKEWLKSHTHCFLFLKEYGPELLEKRQAHVNFWFFFFFFFISLKLDLPSQFCVQWHHTDKIPRVGMFTAWKSSSGINEGCFPTAPPPFSTVSFRSDQSLSRVRLWKNHSLD